MSYRAYDAVIAEGRKGRSGLSHLAMGCVVILLLGYMMTLLLIELVLASDALVDPLTLFEGTTPQTMLVLLVSFVVWPIGLGVALSLVHRRPLTSVLGRHVGPQLLWVLAAMAGLHLALMFLPPWGSADLTQNTPLRAWLLVLPLAVLAVLLQVTAEEVVFRGYLQQALAAYGLPPLIWILVPSILFGLGHYDAGAGSNTWLIVLWAVAFGALMADLTARAGSIGPAIAVHLANNILSLLITGLDDGLNGLALFVYPVGLEDEAALRALLPVDFMLILVSWLAARLALRR